MKIRPNQRQTDEQTCLCVWEYMHMCVSRDVWEEMDQNVGIGYFEEMGVEGKEIILLWITAKYRRRSKCPPVGNGLNKS